MKTLPSSRKHHYLTRVGIFLIAVALVVGVIGCDGDGPDDGDVVKIQTWSDLDTIRNNLGGKYVLVNSLNSTTAGYEELVSDTANEGKGWEPIRGFTGTFDGNGYEIKDLFINRDKEDQVGLFGYIPEANLKDITVLGADVTGRENVGIVVGESRGTMENCSSSGSVTGMNSIGGLAGYNGGYGLVSSNVRYCESTATVCGEEWRTGGLVGYNAPRGYIDSSVFGGNVTGVYQVGGLVGLNNREVKKSVVEVTVNVTGVSAVGGLVGWSTPLTVVEECCFYGHANGGPYVGCDVLLSEGSAVTSLSVDSYEIGWYVGGVVGVNEGTVKDCTSEGSVYGENYVGGLAGWNEAVVSESRSIGSVTGKDYVGGLVGYNAKEGIVSNSDSATDVEGTGIHIGDLVGRNEGIIPGVESRTIIELDFLTFWPSVDFQAAIGHKAWMDTIAARVVAETDGYEISWNALYGGAEPAGQIYSLVQDGVYDVGVTGPSYSWGIFPLWEGPQYPGDLYRNNAYTMSLTLQSLYDEFTPLQKEMAAQNLKVMHFWSTGPGYFFMTEGNEVRTLADFPGKTIRVANLASMYTIETLGVEPILCSMSEAKEKFEVGSLHGILCPGDTPKGFGLYAYVKHCTFAPFSYQFVFMKVMNTATWNALAAEVQTIFNEVNAAWPAYYGQLRTWGEADGLQYCEDNVQGWEYFDWRDDPADYQTAVDVTAHLVDEWIGGDATRQALWDKFVELDEYYATTPPYSTWTPGMSPPPVPTFR
jgi:TRAP-type C4-dicarboxylate transport system substrate-binding protein